MGCVNGCNWGDATDPLTWIGNGAYECDLCGRLAQLDGWPLPSEYYRRARLSSFAKETKTASGVVVGFDPARTSGNYTGLYYLLDASEGLPLTLDDVMWIQQHTTPREMFGNLMTTATPLDDDNDWREYRKVFTDLPSDPRSEEAQRHVLYRKEESKRTNPFPLGSNSILSVYSSNGAGRYPVKVKRRRDDLTWNDGLLAIDVAHDEADLYAVTDSEGYIIRFGIDVTINTQACQCKDEPYFEEEPPFDEDTQCYGVDDANSMTDYNRFIKEEKTSLRVKSPCGTVVTYKKIKPSDTAYREFMSYGAYNHTRRVTENLKRLSGRLLINEGKRRVIIVDNVYETAVAPDDIKEIEKRRDETVRLFAQRRDLSYEIGHYTLVKPEGDPVPVGRWELVSFSKVSECLYEVVTTPHATKLLYSDSGYAPKANQLL